MSVSDVDGDGLLIFHRLAGGRISRFRGGDRDFFPFGNQFLFVFPAGNE